MVELCLYDCSIEFLGTSQSTLYQRLNEAGDHLLIMLNFSDIDEAIIGIKQEFPNDEEVFISHSLHMGVKITLKNCINSFMVLSDYS